MNNSKKLLKLVVLSMLIALGVVISPILRFEGMCPMAHFINIVCSVLLGPWYSLLCATLIGIIRMTIMGIPPLALTGAVFGAFLSGVCYRMSKGKIIFAVVGEIIGTGIIGAIVSYPVMSILWGKEGLSWMFYVPSFICGTLIGGSIAFVFLRKLANSGVLNQFQNKLASKSYTDKSDVVSDSIAIAAFGVICFVVIKILTNIFKMNSPVWSYIALVALIIFIIAAVAYFVINKSKKVKADELNNQCS
ncbi:MAG: energy coupling factor transporter S component ThiW [Clostridia bacterium]|nr:energy coupling factor transporter S component ThiW [Clostridia bacterium]